VHVLQSKAFEKQSKIKNKKEELILIAFSNYYFKITKGLRKIILQRVKQFLLIIRGFLLFESETNYQIILVDSWEIFFWETILAVRLQKESI